METISLSNSILSQASVLMNRKLNEKWQIEFEASGTNFVNKNEVTRYSHDVDDNRSGISEAKPT